MPEAALAPLAVYNARPTVRVNTQEYPLVSELLLGLRMTEREGGLSALELRLSNLASDSQGGADFAFEDNRILKLGANVTLYSGEITEPREIFQGTITGLEADFRNDAPPELVVLAEDVFQRARMKRRTKLHDQITLDDLARDLAGQLGLTPVISGLSDNLGVQMQLNESDLAFLRRLLARYDGDLQIVGQELHVSPRREVRRGTVELVLHRQLRQARVLADLAHQVSELTLSGWDATQGQRIRVSSHGAHFGPGQGQRGVDALSNAFGERSEHLGHLTIDNEAEAQALADAAFDDRARRFVTVCGTAEGNASLRVGTNVTLTGLGDRFSNTYYVTEACHRYDLTKGYETDFKAEGSFWGGN